MKDNGIFYALGAVALVGAVAGYGREVRGWVMGSHNDDEDEHPYPDADVLANEAVIETPAWGNVELAIEGKNAGSFGDFDEALSAFRQWTESNRYYPNLYYVNERGNVALIDYQGNEIASWV